MDPAIKKDILEILSNIYKKSGGHNGITVIEISQKLNLTFADMKPTLTQMRIDKDFVLKKGKGDVLLFDKKKLNN